MKKALVYLKSGSSVEVKYEPHMIEEIMAYLELGNGVITFMNASIKVPEIEAIEWID